MRSFASLMLLLAIAACSRRQAADLIVRNARIYTIDSTFHTAQAMAIRDGKILALGSDEDILHAYHADSILNANGHSLYPGFMDAHSHFLAYGRSLFEVNLFGCSSWDEVLNRVADFARAHPGINWIRGFGWDQSIWADKNFPDNKALNLTYPNTPVLLSRVDGHAAVANAKALSLAHIVPGMKLEGGSIGMANGQLSGLLLDNAADLVKNRVPPPTPAEYALWLDAAQKKCFGQGLTTVSDCGLNYHDIEAMDSLQRQGKLLMRLYLMMSDDTANFHRYLARGPYKTDRLFLKGVKVYADGALGSRGACLLQPYSDKPGWQGFMLSSYAHYDSIARKLINTDFQMCTHAIGDSANRTMLKIYNRYLNGKNDRRWRIEHAQVIAAEDFKLFGASSIIPSVQPTHATSDMRWAEDRLGPIRVKGAYANQQLLAQNGWLPLGTDFPVEDISPFKTFYAAVCRKNAAGNPPGGFQMENALTREQALRGITIWAAKASFLEKEIGSLEAGKKADFVILDRDLMQAPDTALLGARVLQTFSGGRCVFKAP
ncbi:MAG: amidohydrolase [Bacteroidetes bacterium]|nr:amidohydrolase [Bacteroidota bacterium]